MRLKTKPGHSKPGTEVYVVDDAIDCLVIETIPENWGRVYICGSQFLRKQSKKLNNNDEVVLHKSTNFAAAYIKLKREFELNKEAFDELSKDHVKHLNLVKIISENQNALLEKQRHLLDASNKNVERLKVIVQGSKESRTLNGSIIEDETVGGLSIEPEKKVTETKDPQKDTKSIVVEILAREHRLMTPAEIMRHSIAKANDLIYSRMISAFIADSKKPILIRTFIKPSFGQYGLADWAEAVALSPPTYDLIARRGSSSSAWR